MRYLLIFRESHFSVHTKVPTDTHTHMYTVTAVLMRVRDQMTAIVFAVHVPHV